MLGIFDIISIEPLTLSPRQATSPNKFLQPWFSWKNVKEKTNQRTQDLNMLLNKIYCGILKRDLLDRPDNRKN